MAEYQPACRYAVTATIASAGNTMNIPINGTLAQYFAREITLTPINRTESGLSQHRPASVCRPFA